MKFVKASLCLSIALAITGCGEKVSLESHLNNAKSYLTQNKVNESIIELKNAIRLDSKNGEARFLLGKVYLDLGDGPAAAKELERAHSLKYADNKVIPLLARALILVDSDSEVLALSTVASKLSPEEQSQYLAYQTLAALRSEQTELAKESAKLAESLGEQSQYSMLASAYLLLSENKFAEVQTLLARILTIDAKQVDALMLQGQLAMITKEYQLAADSFQQFLTLQPRFGMVKLFLANAHLKAGNNEEAEKHADAIIAQVSSQPFANYIKAMVRFQAKDYKLASEHAETALSSNFNQLNLKLVAGASAFYLENWQQSHHHLSAIIKYLPNDHQGRKMLAVTQLELGLIDEIGATIADFDGNDESNSQFLSSMSYKLLELGATSEAKALLSQSEISSPENASQVARQGILKLMMNDPSGIESLEGAIKLNPDFIEAELALAFAALQGGDIAKAKKIAEKWQDKYPNKAGGFNLIASIAIKEQNYSEAEQALKQSLALESDNLFALTEQLRIARLQKDDSLAKQRADHLLTLAPNNNKVLRHYFGVYRNESALNKLKAAYQIDKKDVSKAILVSEALVSLGQFKEAENILTPHAETGKLPKRYWQLLLLSLKKQNDTEKVHTTLKNWVKANPYHIEAVILLTDYYANQRNYERALNVVKRGIDNHKENLVLQLIQMQLLLNSKQIIPAKSLYKTLAVKNINKALKEGILGRIALLEEDYSRAIPKLTQLYQAYPSSQNAVYLAGSYLGNENKAKAAEVLEHYLVTNPEEGRVKTMLAGIYLENDTDKAIAVYVEVVKKLPKNVVAHNNLAWLYHEKKDLDKALVHAQKAYELAPHIPNVADTYAKVLLGSGDKRAALKYASKASEITKGQDVDIQLNYIEALIANSRSNEAETLLNELVQLSEEQKDKKVKLQAQL